MTNKLLCIAGRVLTTFVARLVGHSEAEALCEKNDVENSTLCYYYHRL